MTAAKPRFDLTAPLPSVADLGAVHVIAVGGAGMSAVARLLLAAGLPVSGSDRAVSATTRALAAEGVAIHLGHAAEHLGAADTVVVSSAVREDNVELAWARAAGLRVLHRSQALAVLMAGRIGVAVAGANGKTTTTALLVAGLQAAGADPSYAVGGELVGLGTNAAPGHGEAFVVEADESDGTFLAYRPTVAVVTSVQPDHLDFYGTFAAVQEAYAAFVGTVRPGGVLVACVDDEGARTLAGHARAIGLRVVGYGFAPDADVRLTDPGQDGLTATATVSLEGQTWPLRVAAPGRHNLQNGAAALSAAVCGLGADPARVLAGLATFGGVRRRFEDKGEAGGIRVVDDYAHNPGKVEAVVRTAAALVSPEPQEPVPTRGPGRLVVVFQPHLYSRTADFADQFGMALAAADVVVVLDVYAAREDPVPGVTGGLVADAVRAVPGRRARDVRFVAGSEDPVPVLVGLLRPGDLVLTVGAGDVTELGPRLLGRLATVWAADLGSDSGGGGVPGGTDGTPGLRPDQGGAR